MIAALKLVPMNTEQLHGKMNTVGHQMVVMQVTICQCTIAARFLHMGQLCTNHHFLHTQERWTCQGQASGSTGAALAYQTPNAHWCVWGVMLCHGHVGSP
jgi:hypothetical protein